MNENNYQDLKRLTKQLSRTETAFANMVQTNPLSSRIKQLKMELKNIREAIKSVNR